MNRIAKVFAIGLLALVGARAQQVTVDEKRDQIEALKIGFANVHEGIDNMNRVGFLPKGVKPSVVGANPFHRPRLHAGWADRGLFVGRRCLDG